MATAEKWASSESGLGVGVKQPSFSQTHPKYGLWKGEEEGRLDSVMTQKPFDLAVGKGKPQMLGYL